VVTEYKGVVYSIDFLNRVHRHFKNNLRKASERSLALFGELPDDIKLVLGGEFDEKVWEEIKTNEAVPEYLKDIEIQHEPQIVTRQRIAEDTHALEQDGPGQNDTVPALDDTTLINDLEETEILEHLKTLHEKTLLTEPDISVNDINRLYRNSVNDNAPTLVANELPDIEENVEVEVNTPKENQRSQNFANVHPDNILQEGTRRHVRFNLPRAKKIV
jgi:hypothetical protein